MKITGEVNARKSVSGALNIPQVVGGGGSITVDAALSPSSENPVQNKVIKAALDGKGTYSKPSGGIPKTDLANAVQTSLGKADTALQEHQDISGKQDTLITSGATVGQIAKITAVDANGKPTAWEAADITGDQREWSLLATVDCSETSGNIILSDLDNYTEFYFEASLIANDSTTASGYGCVINGTLIFENIIAIGKKGSTQYQSARIKYNGLYWEIYNQGVATLSSLVRAVGLNGPYNYKKGVGEASVLKLSAPATQYQANTGTLLIYGR